MRPADDRRLRCAGDLTSALLLLPVPSVGRRPHGAAGASASKGGQLCCGCSRQLQAFQCTAAQAAPRRSGMDAIIWAWTTALGWPSPHTLPMRHAHAMPNRTLPASPANPPCQSTRQANSLHTQHARRLPSFHLSLCFAHPLSPQRRFDLALFFLFFSYPSHHSHPACSSAFFLFAPVLLAISKSILSRAFCRRSIALAVGPCLQSSSTQSTTPPSRFDPPDPRASSTPPDENTRRACCLLFPRVSFVLSPWHWTAGVFRAFGALRGTDSMQTSTRTSSRRRPGPGREPGRGPGCGLGLGLEDMGWIM